MSDCACLLLARSLSPEARWAIGGVTALSMHERSPRVYRRGHERQGVVGRDPKIYASSLPPPTSSREDASCIASHRSLKPRTIYRSRSRSPRRSPRSAAPSPLAVFPGHPVRLVGEGCARYRSPAEIAEGERARESGGWMAGEDRGRRGRARSRGGGGGEFRVALLDVGAKFRAGPRKLRLLSLGKPMIRDGP